MKTETGPRLLGLPRWIAVLLTVVLVGGVSFAAFEFLLPGRIPPELVGKWKVVGGPMDSTIFEFQRNGTMIGKRGKYVVEGTALVSEKTLRTTSTNPYTGKEEAGTQTIVSLTETEFVTEDKNGTRITMHRIR